MSTPAAITRPTAAETYQIDILLAAGRPRRRERVPGVVIRKRAPRSTQRIDVTRLPEDVVALIDALEPGENLVLTRDGASIATISSTIDVVTRRIRAAGVPVPRQAARVPARLVCWGL
ncbi:hypothetical protein ABZ297_05335 [Nonomuraea sp. NPDC005983]|uniref:hypothetical protein n=1 Tax=Nonomuraea sp. NPDC005983 TaxID=3155595 RepID=UPI0033BE9C63